MGLSGLENRFKNACDQMLQAMCMGMTATKKATPSSNLKLGVIEVDKSGIPRLIEILSNAQFESFLYVNSKFESPSRAKFNYGKLFKIKDELFIDLNFQVRLK
jgi:type II restriction enzyme